MKQSCTNCGWAEYKRQPSGRRILDQQIKCTCDITLPLSYCDYRGDMPLKRDVSKYTCLRNECQCWKPASQKE